jgi:2-phospho-L-lactate guanylyltransferase
MLMAGNVTAVEAGEPRPHLPYTPAVSAVVFVPVKAFSGAKQRLADVLTPSERERLARRLATHVLAQAAPLPVAVVCDDDEVAAWAHANGATTVWTPGLGLNGAIQHAVDTTDANRAIVVHGDLPLAASLAWLAEADPSTAIVVPDRTDDGTNALSVPTGHGFGFAYGPASFRRHCAEVTRCGLALRIERRGDLALDIDHPDDLALLPAWATPGDSST